MTPLLMKTMLPDDNFPPLDDDARCSLTTTLAAPSQRCLPLPHDDACCSLMKTLNNKASLFLTTMLNDNASCSLTLMYVHNASRFLTMMLDNNPPQWQQRHCPKLKARKDYLN
jgi:hypothetical protein